MSGVSAESVKAGNVAVSQSFAGGVGGSVGAGTFVAPLAVELLRPYLRPSKKIRRA
jgi:hypothetical protein